MAIIGLSLDATKPYELAADPAKGTQDATVFTLGTLDGRIMGRIRDHATTVSADAMGGDQLFTHVNVHEMRFQTCQYGIKGWRNWPDAQGKEIPFKTVTITVGGAQYEVVDPEVLRRMRPEEMEEIATAIRVANTVTLADAGNSAS